MRRLLLLGLLGSIGAGCFEPQQTCFSGSGTDEGCPPRTGNDIDPPPSFHVFHRPAFLTVGGEHRVLVLSAGIDYAAWEEVDPVTGARVATPIGTSHQISVACGDACVAAWRDPWDGEVRSAVRSAAGWSATRSLGEAVRAPAVAVAVDVTLVATARSVHGSGDRIELHRLDATGAVTASWTLVSEASIPTHMHLSVAASASSGLVTWIRTERVGRDNLLWFVAQPLGADGAPSGAPFERPIAHAAADYYRAAPAAFVDGAYRVAPGAMKGTWYVIDPDARTIVERSLGTLEFPREIQSIVPTAEGALATLSSAGAGEVVRIVDDRIVQSIAVGNASEPPGIAVTADGVHVAFVHDDSLYLAQWSTTLVAATEATLLAERYELEPDGASCSTGHGLGPGMLLAVGLGLGLGLRRRSRAARHRL